MSLFYVYIIEIKSTETTLDKKKTQAWKIIYESFNELNMRPREFKEMKQQWRTLKIDTNNVVSDNHIAGVKTGVGLRHSLDEDSQIVMKLLPLEFEVEHNKLFSDGSSLMVQVKNERNSPQRGVEDQSPDICNILSETQHENENECSEPEDSIQAKACSPTNNSSNFQYNNQFKRKKHTVMGSGVKVSREAQQISDTAIERSHAAMKCLEQELKLKLQHMQETQELKLKHMSEAHEWAREEHNLRMQLLRKKNDA